MRGFCHRIAGTGSSFIRLNVANQKKLGGGTRVKRISTGDNWSNMQRSGADPSLNTEYIQEYSYTTTDPLSGKTISSGVAAYEPMIGNDENPMVQPVPYTVERTWAAGINKHQLEPFGESFMPAPQIGYSRVSVQILNQDGINTTGQEVSEFYTAKDFPVRLARTDLEALHRDVYIPAIVYNKRLNAAVVSQGFVIETNDMHGRPKSNRTYDAFGVALKGSDYLYKQKDGHLDNQVPAVSKENQTVNNRTLGVFWDVTVDGRQYFHQIGDYGGGLNIEYTQYGPVPVVIPTLVPNITEAKSEFRSLTITKTIHRTGILDRVIAFDNGASMATESRLWDAQTGHVLLSATENSFKQWMYNLSIPAYWAYSGMGHAASNEGMQMTNIALVNGLLMVGAQARAFAEGDEIWLTPTITTATTGSARTAGMALPPAYSTNAFRIEPMGVRIINRQGSATAISNGQYDIKVRRSGRKNMLSAKVGTLTTLTNPAVLGSPLNLNPSRVLAAQAQTFSDYWQTDMVLQPSYENRNCNCREITATDSPFNKLQQTIAYLFSDPSRLTVNSSTVLMPGGLRYEVTSNSGNRLDALLYLNATAMPCPFSVVSSLSLDLINNQSCSFNGKTLRFGEVEGGCASPNYFMVSCGQSGNNLRVYSDCIPMLDCREVVTRGSSICAPTEANPYLNSILGCWRPLASYAPVTGRSTSLHTTESGFLTDFTPFWVSGTA